jgi:hypothetical protein
MNVDGDRQCSPSLTARCKESVADLKRTEDSIFKTLTLEVMHS